MAKMKKPRLPRTWSGKVLTDEIAERIADEIESTDEVRSAAPCGTAAGRGRRRSSARELPDPDSSLPGDPGPRKRRTPHRK
jgi:hypothetical protein